MMTSPLNPLNKLEAADNTTTEPNPTNIVDEDNVFFYDYIDLKKASRDNKIYKYSTLQSFKDSLGRTVSWSKSWRRMRTYLLLGPFIASSFGFSKLVIFYLLNFLILSKFYVISYDL